MGGGLGLEGLLHLAQGLGHPIGQGVDRAGHHEKLGVVGHGLAKLIADDRAGTQDVEDVIDQAPPYTRGGRPFSALSIPGCALRIGIGRECPGLR